MRRRCRCSASVGVVENRFSSWPAPNISAANGTQYKVVCGIEQQDSQKEQYALNDGIFNMTCDGTDGQGAGLAPVFVCFNGGPSTAQARAVFLSQDDGQLAIRDAYVAELNLLYTGFAENLYAAGNQPFLWTGQAR